MRKAELTRTTRETDIRLELDLDGSGKTDISTGIGFFDHMLEAFALHGSMDLTLWAKGDLQVDCHHTVEDVGIVLGQALGRALGDKSTIQRYGSFFVPMDEALAHVTVDVSGRPFLVFNARFSGSRVGTFDCCMAKEFFRAVAAGAGLTLHINVPYGENDHHILEAVFKAAGHALSQAAAPRQGGVLSTKGMLE